MQFLSRLSRNFKIARVNQVRFSVRFVTTISQGFQTCLKLDATLERQKFHRVAVTKIACVNGPLGGLLWEVQLYSNTTHTFCVVHKIKDWYIGMQQNLCSKDIFYKFQAFCNRRLLKTHKSIKTTISIMGKCEN